MSSWFRSPCRPDRAYPSSIRGSAGRLALCLPWLLILVALGVTAQEPPVVINYDTLTFRPTPRISYLASGLFQKLAGATNFFMTMRDGRHAGGDSLYTGDRVRIRTVGSYAIPVGKDGNGNTIWSAEEPRPFLGLYAAAIGDLGGSYKPYSPADTGLPPYVTPVRTSGTTKVPTDTPFDFLIPSDWLTFCIPSYGNFLCLLNPDPNVVLRDTDGDFAIEIQPLEKTRLLLDPQLSTTNIAVGDVFTLTIKMQNIGNTSGRNLDIPPQTYNTNLLELLSGPVPASIAELPAGGTDTFTYTFRATGPGLVAWQFTIHLDACGGHYGLWTATVGITPIHDPFQVEVVGGPRIIGVGQQFSLDVRAINGGGTTLTNVHPNDLIDVAGDGGVERATGPDPDHGVTLVGASSATFHYTFTGTNAGQVTFTAAATGVTTNGVTQSATNSSRTLLVSPGNLILKRAIEPDSLYAGTEEYLPVPAPPQIKTNTVALKEESRFDLEVVNVDTRVRSFLISASPDARPGWKATYLLDTQDISTSIESPAGMALAPLPPGQAYHIQVVMVPTNGIPGDLKRIDFTLGLANSGGLVLDTAEVESRLGQELIVNSTGDLPLKDPQGCCCDTGRKLSDGTPECSLRAALQLANATPGREIIRFHIPSEDPNFFGGHPLIAPRDALPDITDTVLIDGFSQSPGASAPPVELSGTKIKRPPPPGVGDILTGVDLLDWAGAVMGLKITSPDCEVRGLVINSFPLCGIGLGPDAHHCVIQGNYIGTDASGTQPLANGFGADAEDYIRGCGLLVTSAGNLIGGTSQNVISGITGSQWDDTAITTRYAPPGIVIANPGASGNRVIGNVIGLTPTGVDLLQHSLDPDGELRGPIAGIWIISAPGNQVGGLNPEDESRTADANIIGGNWVGVRISGVDAAGNHVAGNLIGIASGSFSGDAGILIDNAPGTVIGGGSTEARNVISGNTVGVLVQGPGSEQVVIEGNYIGATDTLFQPATAGSMPGNVVGVAIGDGADAVTVVDNQLFANLQMGLFISGANDTMVATNLIQGNGHGGYPEAAGVRIAAGNGNTLTANSIFDSQGLGIALGLQETPLPNDAGDGDGGPNGDQNHPVLLQGQTLGTDLAPGQYTLEFFASAESSATGYGEGEHYLGSTRITVPSIDLLFDAADLGFGFPGTAYISATATGPDGSTSEFSESVLLQDCIPGPSGVCPSLEDQVPGYAPPAPPASPQSAAAPPPALTGDGNGDGIPDSTQDNVVSLPTIGGSWVTLAGPASSHLLHVRSSGPPDLAHVPSATTFPVGFLTFGVSGVSPGGAVAVAEIFHWPSPARTPSVGSVYLFGRTPDNRQPHYYEFTYDGVTGAEILADRIVLHFRDGARGDDDLQANGTVTASAAAAVTAPVPPVLSIAGVETSMIQQQVLAPGPGGGASIIVVREVPQVTATLAWPTGASASGYGLFYRESLGTALPALGAQNTLPESSGNWRRVTVAPVIQAGRNTVTLTTSSSTRFYTLRPLR